MKFKSIAVAIAIVAVPGALMAGSYGSAGVSDDRVGRQASNGQTVYCGRLDRTIPVELAAEMDCGGSAKPQVANTGVGGFFGDLRRVARDIVTDDDNPSPKTPPEITPTPVVSPPPTPPVTSTTSKWERLNELGVTQENYTEQSQSFQDQAGQYFSEHGSEGDWSGFNPTE